jgi:VanZ family protein
MKYKWMIMWGIMIFTISSIPDFKERKIMTTEGIDKVFHFIEYFIFGILIFQAKVKGKGFWGLTIVFPLVDEVHQKFIPGREVEVLDLLINYLGICIGILVWRWRWYLREGEKKLSWKK